MKKNFIWCSRVLFFLQLGLKLVEFWFSYTVDWATRPKSHNFNVKVFYLMKYIRKSAGQISVNTELYKMSYAASPYRDII